MRYFTLDEARSLMPEVLRRANELIPMRAEFAARAAGHGPGAGGLAEAKALEAHLSEQLDWFVSEGIEVKGWAPLLLDFPLRRSDEVFLLCWLEGEETLGWYHPAEQGFAGRRRLDDLAI